MDALWWILTMETNSSQFVPILRNPSDFFLTNLPFLFLQVPDHLAKPLTTACELMYLYLWLSLTQDIADNQNS